jgi:mono/diheme cytochrome c family protein
LSLNGFIEIMRAGRAPDGRAIDPITMPWPHYASLTDRDLEAIYVFLRSLPPTANQIPPTEPTDGLDAMIYKVRALSGGPSGRIEFHAFNAGDPSGRAPKAKPLPKKFWQTVAVGLALVLAVEALYLWRPGFLTGLRRRRRRRHRTFREFVRGPVYLLSTVAAVGILAIAWWPPARVGSPEQTIERMAPPLPPPVGLSGNGARIADLGRYLVGGAACGSCHTTVNPLWPMERGEPLAGGTELAWAPMGRWYASNLTSDAETGLGEVSAEAIRRLLRSGIGPDGSLIHRAAMPWDFTSVLTAEELEAVVTYLKALPPVRNEVPSSRRHGGPAIYTMVPEP